MNELLRLFQKSLRPFGYDIRKRGRFNLLPARGITSDDCLNRVRKNFDHDGQSACDVDFGKLRVVFRTCLTAKRNLKNEGRVAGTFLIDTVERCFLSLINSINKALLHDNPPQIEVIILDDRSDDNYLERIKSLASRLQCPWKLQTTKVSGQGASLYEQFEMARNDDALYYFCEDDYLHDPQAIYEMWAFYRQIFATTNRHLVIHPQEHCSLYTSSHHPAYLVLSPFRHWRSVSDMTHCLFLHSHVVRDYWDYFENTKFVGNRRKRHLGSEKKTTNRLFDHLPGFSPIPALAGHFQAEELLPPFFDWQSLWNASDPF